MLRKKDNSSGVLNTGGVGRGDWGFLGPISINRYLMAENNTPIRPSGSTQWRATRPGQGTPTRPAATVTASASVPLAAATTTPATSTSPSSGSSQVETRKEDFFWDGDIVLTLKHARGVIAADVNGTSDPYCKVYLKSDKDNLSFVDGWKTKIHWKTLNPDWNEVCPTKFGEEY